MEYLSAAPVASVLFLLTIAISLFAFSNDTVYSKLMLHPHSVYRGSKTYTIITSGFIHKDFTHLFFNMVSYCFFAFQLEANIGHWQFAVLYMVSLALSDLPSILKHKNDFWYHSLGASGAISAVVFSAILFNPRGSMIIFPIPFAIPAYIFGVLYLVYCAYMSKQSHDAINHDAHFFGAISGVLVTIILNHQIIPHFLQQFGL